MTVASLSFNLTKYDDYNELAREQAMLKKEIEALKEKTGNAAIDKRGAEISAEKQARLARVERNMLNRRSGYININRRVEAKAKIKLEELRASFNARAAKYNELGRLRREKDAKAAKRFVLKRRVLDGIKGAGMAAGVIGVGAGVINGINKLNKNDADKSIRIEDGQRSISDKDSAAAAEIVEQKDLKIQVISE